MNRIFNIVSYHSVTEIQNILSNLYGDISDETLDLLEILFEYDNSKMYHFKIYFTCSNGMILDLTCSYDNFQEFIKKI